MKWVAKDMDLYHEAKEYVDTVLVPLIPVTFGNQMKQLSSAGEFITILSFEIERNFKGRIFLSPSVHYLKENKDKISTLQNWEHELLNNGFSHIVYLTSDINWKKDEMALEGLLLWIPSISLELLEMEQAKEVMRQQTQQIIDILREKWEIE